ncbi:hypothetical protein M427DRAFT_39866 [Gonapodya prolifera JEL478]|uniref:Uncharacterized protein n=1 Tax=Gonapodya prolifera (strain JEL478) TaxID=1344416 RepID=A0A138ZWJ5_GONPJ|nr:hypothetical protein M427DRAFT_39866 [Gonapodya prolifera JEL478]|eukprot:KXS08867.1 hypothetical protein M427DRAFT_39866 [Gonapodya prolifera JEL478]
MTPYNTYISMRRAITFTNSKGKLLTNADIVATFEGTPHVITQINSWLAVTRYYCVVPNTLSPTARTIDYQLALSTWRRGEGAVGGQKPGPCTAKMKEVKEMAKLWGEVYIPWINSVYDLNVSQGWTDDKKEQARKLIIEGTFFEQHTRAEMIAELATMLEITCKGSTGGKEKEKGNLSTSANLPAMDADPKTPQVTSIDMVYIV